MRIAVLYLAIGEYDRFWPIFFSSCEAYFCPNHEKKYFIFTDSKEILSTESVYKIDQDNLGWPFNTLYRYRIFLRKKKELEGFDKIIFLNGNCEFKKVVTYTEFFGSEKGLVAGIHPGYFDKTQELFPYEKRISSTAFVHTAHKYYPGGLMGGSPSFFLSACLEISLNIELDLDKGIVALWHDESHWNAYLNNGHNKLQSQLHLLSPSYLYPEGWDIPFQRLILLREKSKTIDVARLKASPKIDNYHGSNCPIDFRYLIDKLWRK